MARAVTPAMSAHFAALHAEHGATILHESTVAKFVGNGAVSGVELGDRTRLDADVVVIGVGSSPNVELAEGSRPRRSATGSSSTRRCGRPIRGLGDRRLRELPERPGRPAGPPGVGAERDRPRARGRRRDPGEPAPYDALPWFWSDQHSRKPQIAGLLHGHDTTVLRGDPEGEAFSVFCFDGDRLVRVESVNRMPDHMAARKLLTAGRTIDPAAAADEAFDLKAYAAAG